MVERIKTLIEKQNLTATQFAEEIGVQRSAVSHLLSGRNKPSLDFMLKIKNRFPEISLDWLLIGRGKMKEVEKVDEKNQPETTQASMFKLETEQKREGGLTVESLDRKSEIPKSVFQPESETTGIKSTEERAGFPIKMIFIYPDNTFKVFDTR